MNPRQPPLHVANVIEEGRLGGPQVRIVEVATHLKQHGVRTTVILPRHDSEDFTALLAQREIEYLKKPLRRLTRQKRKLFQYALLFPLEVIGLWLHFRKAGYDAVHCSGGCWQVKALLAARMAGIPALWHLNDTGTPRILRRTFKMLARWCPAGLIVAADRVRQYYIQNNDLHYLPIYEVQAPVDTAYFSPGVTKASRAIPSDSGLAVVMVCSVNPAKGVEHLVAAAQIIQNERSDIHIHIVGPTHGSQTSYRQQLDRQIHDNGIRNITFHGSQTDVRPFLKAANIYVCSSVREASPLSVWEAMSMASAIVATDVGDVARFLRNDANGLIVSPADPEALAQGILKLAADPELRERYGTAARLTVIKELDVKIIAKRQADAYRDLLQRLKPSPSNHRTTP